MAGIKTSIVDTLFVVMWLFICTAMILIGVKHVHDQTRQIFLTAHECYNQELCAVLIDGKVECRE